MFQDVCSLPCNPRSVQDGIWGTRLLGCFSVFFSRARRPEQKGVAEYTWELWRALPGRWAAGSAQRNGEDMCRWVAGMKISDGLGGALWMCLTAFWARTSKKYFVSGTGLSLPESSRSRSLREARVHELWRELSPFRLYIAEHVVKPKGNLILSLSSLYTLGNRSSPFNNSY